MRVRTRTVVLSVLSLIALCLYLISPFGMIPVPWPDDSAFILAGFDWMGDFFHFQMRSQAPFEPSYLEWNFNTMPLLPLLSGLSQKLGLVHYPWVRLPGMLGLLLSLVVLWRVLPNPASIALFVFNPWIRWGGTILRPEAWISACAAYLVCLLFEKRDDKKAMLARSTLLRVSGALALAAYFHFNAIHLLLPVVVAYLTVNGADVRARIKALAQIAGYTAALLSPWVVTVLLKPSLFFSQMQIQWERLSMTHNWFNSPKHFLKAWFPDHGVPNGFPDAPLLLGAILWLAAIAVLILPLVQLLRKRDARPSLMPASWLLSALLLCYYKPEQWFIYYAHVALTFSLCLLMWPHTEQKNAFSKFVRKVIHRPVRPVWVDGAPVFLLFFTITLAGFTIETSREINYFNSHPHFTIKTYREWIDCIDQKLTSTFADQVNAGALKPGRRLVWAPTFPDVLVELRARHPDWELTRTNDFWSRSERAIEHGFEADAVVVTEMYTSIPRTLSIDRVSNDDPRVPRSLWMNWKDYFLNKMTARTEWTRQNRTLSYCQNGTFQAYLYLR